MIRKLIGLLLKDPKLLARKIGNRLRPHLIKVPSHPVRKKVDGVWFHFDFDLDESVEAMYSGVYEIPTIEALRRYLKKGDSFLDVGASIGYISARGAGLVGTSGQVHSFEPVPRFYRFLSRVSEMNSDFTIVTNNCAVGEEEGYAQISVSGRDNLGWNTMVPGFMAKTPAAERLEVKVIRLDRYMSKNRLERVSLIKIDTEGFEFPVLKGLTEFFREQQVENLPVLIVEIAPEAYPKLNSSLQSFAKWMDSFSFRAYTVDEDREIDLTTLQATTNVLFKPDPRRTGRAETVL